jgi:universal stress protein E
MERILAATDFSTRSQRASRQAGLLARQTGAQLTLLHVVDEDQPAHLIQLERGEAEAILNEQVGSVAELQGIECRIVVMTGDAFDAILRTAESVSANLLVMGTHRKQLLRDIFVGTTIERVVRTGPCPVLMVNKEAAHSYSRVLAAVDMSDISAHAVRSARALGFSEYAHLTVVHAFEALAKGKLFMADVPKERIDDYVAQERQRASAELATFLQSQEVGGGVWSRRVEEGEPLRIISAVATEIDADLLVIGTHGRTGIAKVLLGSVAEQVLRTLNVDILAVPPVAARG